MQAVHADLHDALERSRDLIAELRNELQADAGSPRAARVRQLLEQLQGCVDSIGNDVDELSLELGFLDLIARHHPPETALTEALHFLTQRLGLDASGIRLRVGKDFPYFATTGFSEDFVAAESSLCTRRGDASSDDLECLCGTVIRGDGDRSRPFFTPRGSFWTNSSTELLARHKDDRSVAKARGRCHTEGYESVVLIPLRSERETFGLLQFNDRRRGRFSEHRVALLEEMADYLARLLVE